jgi:hypothetical protein
MRRLLMATTALLCLGAVTPASAVLLGGVEWNTDNTQILQITPVVPDGNQPLNVQCLICGAHQPQQSGTFGYTNFGNSGSLNDIIYFSTNVSGGGNPGADTLGIPYDGSFLRAYLEATGATTFSFSVGIDVNQTNVAQTLESFYMLNVTQQLVLAAFSPEPGGYLLTAANNGTGFPDYTLGEFTLALGTPQFNEGDQIVFFARMSGANDGPDSFFLQPSVQAAVPELSTWFMMIVGFLGVGGLAMRKRNQDGTAFRFA